MAPSRYITRCLLGAHGFLLCVCLLGMASAQPTGAQPQGAVLSGVEGLLAELSSGSVSGAAAFRLFVQRAQMVIAGLIHVSILVLPKIGSSEAEKVSNNGGNTAHGGGKGKRGGGGGKAASTPAGAAAGDVAPGTTADGSDAKQWERVNAALERQSASGLDWSNCCVYEVSTSTGAVAVAPAPPYGLPATAAFAAAHGGGKEGIICNDYGPRGPHFSDWEALAAKGARSLAAAPLFEPDSDRVVGVLTLASSEAHAFERSRVVWLLAMALAPLAAGLRYASAAARLDGFIARIMLPLLKENYARTTGSKEERKAAAERRARRAARSVAVAAPAPATAAAPAGRTSFDADSAQFAEHAEVLIAPPAAGGGTNAAAGGGKPGAAETRPGANGHAPNGVYTPEPPVIVPSAKARARTTPDSTATATAAAPAAKTAVVSPAVTTTTAPTAVPPPGTTATTTDTGSASSVQQQYCSEDLDWGDFLFNLISMCIVYAYFSEAAVGGENRAAVGAVSIAAVDIALLALRWLWYEQHLSYGGAVFQAFHVYRLVVLPVANTWMTWSLLAKLGIHPGPAAVTALAAAFGGLLLAGLRARSLLQAPLQLASVALAAAATPQLCGAALGVDPTGLRCMAAASLFQFCLGVVLPTVAVYVADMRATTAKRYPLPHVQAKRGLVAA